MKLRRFLLRYYPPGIILEYEQGGELRNKPVDLLTLTPESDLEVLVNQVVRQEALISENRKPQLRKLLCVAPPPCQPEPQAEACNRHDAQPATEPAPSLHTHTPPYASSMHPHARSPQPAPRITPATPAQAR